MIYYLGKPTLLTAMETCTTSTQIADKPAEKTARPVKPLITLGMMNIMQRLVWTAETIAKDTGKTGVAYYRHTGATDKSGGRKITYAIYAAYPNGCWTTSTLTANTAATCGDAGEIRRHLKATMIDTEGLQFQQVTEEPRDITARLSI